MILEATNEIIDNIKFINFRDYITNDIYVFSRKSRRSNKIFSYEFKDCATCKYFNIELCVLIVNKIAYFRLVSVTKHFNIKKTRFLRMINADNGLFKYNLQKYESQGYKNLYIKYYMDSSEQIFIHPILFGDVLSFYNSSYYIDYMYWRYSNESLKDNNFNIEKFIYGTKKTFSNTVMYENNYLGLELLLDYDSKFILWSSIITSDIIIDDNIRKDLNRVEFHDTKLLCEYLNLDIKNMYMKKRYAGNSCNFIDSRILLSSLYGLNKYKFEKILLKWYENQKIIKNKLETIRYDYSINLSDFITEQLNERFAIGIFAEIPFLIDLDTQYFQPSYTAKIMEPTKLANINRFKNLENIKELESLINLYLKNNNDESSYQKTAIYKYESKLTDFNDNNLKINDVKTFNGYYYHVDLFIQFVMWINPIKGMQFNRLLMNLLAYGEYKNINIHNFINKMGYENVLLREENKLLKNNITKKKGSIKFTLIDEENLIYRIQAENYILLKSKNSFIKNIQDSVLIEKLLYKYVKKYPQDYINAISKKLYHITDEERVKQLINDLFEEKIIVNESNDSIESLILLHKKQLINAPNFAKGKLLEDYIATTFENTILWKNLSPIYLYKFGLSNKDIGIDLIDPVNKIAYQCKDYIEIKKNNLILCFRTFDMIKRIDNQYVLKLIVPEHTIINSDLEEMEIIKIPNNYIELI